MDKSMAISAPAASMVTAFASGLAGRLIAAGSGGLGGEARHRSPRHGLLRPALQAGRELIKDHAGAMRHEVDAGRFHARRRAQRILYVMLACRAGHAQYGKCQRFCSRFAKPNASAGREIGSSFGSRCAG
jgi:hypothetical protein